MAGLPPGQGQQPGPPQGGPPGQPPQGPPQPQGPQAPPPPKPPTAQPGQSPSPNVYADLSVDMPPQWQLVDVATRNIMAALQTGAFYKQPPVYAALKDISNTLTRLISSYSSQNKPVNTDATKGGGAGKSSAVSESDADSEPDDSSDSFDSDLGDSLD
jgi:hypothetical protein